MNTVLELIGGIVLMLAGALLVLFFESYRDFTLRKLRSWGWRDTALTSNVPFGRIFVLTIRGFGVIFVLAGLMICLNALM